MQSHNPNTQFTSKTTYLVLPTHRHIVPISGLKKEQIKKSAKQIIRNVEENPPIQTIQNYIAKALGCKGGFPRYEDFEKEIKSFRKKNNLKDREDLINHRYLPGSTEKLSYRQVSDRLFFSGKEMPSKLFTGFNFDWRTFSDFYHFEKQFYMFAPAKEMQQRYILPVPKDFYARYWEYSWCYNLLGDSLVCPLLGDGFIPFGFLPARTPEQEELEFDEMRGAFKEFRQEFMNQSTKGWVEVLPFNESIVFLKAPNGSYDFVFKNQRNEEPTPKFQEISPQYLPKTYQKNLYRFQTPEGETNFYPDSYFEMDVWEEKLIYDSENLHYKKTDGKVTDPGQEELKSRFQLEENKKPLKKKKSSSKKQTAISGFQEVTINKKTLFVSDLISIEQFQTFLDKTGYNKSRKPDWDLLEPVNNETDKKLPACLTWYDAVAYASWLENEYGVNARLLTIEEYKKLFPSEACVKIDTMKVTFLEEILKRYPGLKELDSMPVEDVEEVLYKFPSLKTQIMFTGHMLSNQPFLEPPDTRPDLKWFTAEGLPFTPSKYIEEEEEWQKIQAKFNLTKDCWVQTKDKLNFLVSYQFGEWLDEHLGSVATAINTRTLLSAKEFCLPLEKHLFPFHSCGKYKHIKIGFRLCYTS